MAERLLLSLAVILFAFSVYAVTRGLHMMAASRLVPDRNRPTVLYFRSDSCGPCLAQSRYVEQVQQDFAGRVQIEKIDADVDRERASRFGIFTVPTILIVDRDGNVRHINYGLTDARKLAHQLKTVAGEKKGA